MKRIFTLLLLCMPVAILAQQYNNEWINFNQTYYKFKVGATGVYRIPQAVIQSAGLAGTPVEQFQLWRNGKEVTFYSTVNSGPLSAADYLEFWGEANDGKPDKSLYRKPAYQHSDKLSLQTDTAAYFLTVTPTGGKRYINVVNDVAGNSLPVEPYFWHTEGMYFRTKLNAGFAAVVGEYVYSSSYDKGEYFSSGDILPASPLPNTKTPLHPYTGGPDAFFRFGASGNALNERHIRVSLNNSILKDTAMDFFSDVHTSATVPVSLLNSDSANVVFTNTSGVTNDRMVISYYELTYPRQFAVDSVKNFYFELPAKAAGYYLEISGFKYGALAPVLYDMVSGERYIGDLGGGKVRFALPGSTVNRKMVLVNQESTNTYPVSSLTARNFTNFTNAANQGNYIIISNPLLYNGTTGNPVQQYANYRKSADGGSYNVIIADINELVDQFAFGIKKHPNSIRNFIRYARANFASQPQYVFLIGRGVAYMDYRRFENMPDADKLNLVPTFGSPASDNNLSAQDSMGIAVTPIGRLSVVSPKEIEDYLEKMKEYETQQRTAPNTLAGRDWMKNIIHVTGASDYYLGTVLCSYMDSYKAIIQDTLVGAKVITFCKTSANPIEQLSNDRITQLFEEGLSVVSYFGHSSSTTLEFNLDNPQAYNNTGKYPVFLVNGCNAGNFFIYDPLRFTYNETLSEKFTLAKQKGGIAFVASTHFGIVNYLNIYVNSLYKCISQNDYGKSLGIINRDALAKMVSLTGPDDYYARLHAEEITIHGDPALRFNFPLEADYIIEEPQIRISPAFISIAEDSFNLKAKLINIGKAVPDSITIEVKRQYPNGTTATILRKRIPGIRYSDSLDFNIPIIATRDKGANRITVTIDADNNVVERSETNNSATKDVFIYEDEARPVYPYEYAIIKNPVQKLYASTANPFSNLKDYVMEIDTTTLFNSPLKRSKQVSSVGGVLEFDPGFTYQDSLVYYWRTALIPAAGGQYHWNSSSFMYKPNTDGFNQSHYFQHLGSDLYRISLEADRKWHFGSRINNLFVRNTVYPTGGTQDVEFSISVNSFTNIMSACVGRSLIFVVFDPVTFKPWRNVDASNNNLYLYGSGAANCAFGRQNNIEFSYMTAASRKKMMDFMDSIPAGAYVVVRNIPVNSQAGNTYAADWKADTTLYGSGKSLYHSLVAAGMTQLDSFYRPRAFSFVYKKGDPTFAYQQFSEGIYDRITMPVSCPTPDTIGYITSPLFGPAKAWKTVEWRGSSIEAVSTDNPSVEVIGVDASHNETVLYNLDKNTQDFDVSAVDPQQYPFLKLRMTNMDSVNLSPFQLDHWRILYDPIPEGALAPNLFYLGKDTLEVGEKLTFGIAFKNISQVKFDSLRVKTYILDRNNVPHYLDLPRTKPLISGDTVKLIYEIDTEKYPEMNTLFLDVNPENDQPEQYHFNNFMFRNFYVKPDKKNPLLDVTFDGAHILNRDIVSARPHIQIKLKDEAKFLLLNDTALTTVQLRFPDQAKTLKTYKFNTDTLRFTPATSGADNTATLDFFPDLTQQFNENEDEYELIVKGKDRSGNKAGSLEYRVTFRIINKPMFSNLLNYPNPFTTSTAFVFTITGHEIPQNIKIQVLTVTGKIVREITKDELGPLRIGRNITEFKWDGTDQYGQRLANGVYLYRVVTTLNGKRMDKFTDEGDNTDKFFTRGYGKMYLMR